VDDFEKFRQSLDFLEISNADEGQLCMDARGKSPALVNASNRANLAPSEMERVRSEMNRLRGGGAGRPSISRPGMPPSFADLGNGAATPEISEHVRSTIKEMEEAARPAQLPDESDPDYYRKLCDLIIDDNAHFSRSDAIAVLVATNPNEIPDAEVRKQIARNFRAVANSDRAGFDREKAIRGLVIYGGKFSAPILIELIEKEELRVEPIALDALAAIKDPKGAEALVKQLGNFFNHQAAVSALRKTGSIAEPALIRAAPSNDAKISVAAVELLGEVGSDKSLMVLRRAQDSRNSDVRLAAANSLRQISERKKTGEAIAADEPVDLFAMFSQAGPRRARPRSNAPPRSESPPPSGSGTPSGNPALRRIN
jgi:HEAT repeat protein